MRILLAGGGTGGHIYPALTVAEEIQRLRPESKLLFAGTARGLEADLAPRAGLDFAPVHSGALVRTAPLAFLGGVWQMLRGVADALAILGRFRPDVILATGGYVCGPILAAAVLRRCPYVLWEGNAYPGSTVRLFARWACNTVVPYPESARYFGRNTRLSALGRPVRRAVLAAERAGARQELGFVPMDEVVLVFGGSQGARGIHRAVVAAAPRLLQRPHLKLLHVTGQQQYDSVRDMYQAAGIDLDREARIRVRPYLHNMPTALAAADVGVIRGGANSVAEVSVRRLPAVVVPFPYSTHGHQEHNARALAARGAAIILVESALTGETLAAALLGLLADPEGRRRMAAALQDAGDPEAGVKIARLVLACIPLRTGPS